MLPSDIARLVLAYLHEEGLETTYRAFLMESPHLEELRQNPNACILRPSTKTLVATLEEYEDIKDTEKRRYGPDKVLNGLWRKFDSVVGQLKYKYQSDNNENSPVIQSRRSQQNLVILRHHQASDVQGHARNNPVIQPKIQGQLIVPSTTTATVTMVTGQSSGTVVTPLPNTVTRVPLPLTSAQVVFPAGLQNVAETSTVLKTSPGHRPVIIACNPMSQNVVNDVVDLESNVATRQRRDSGSSVHSSFSIGDLVECSQLTPMKQKLGSISRQDAGLFKSPKRKSVAPKRKPTKKADYQKKADPPPLPTPSADEELEEALKDIPQVLETLLSNKELQKKLAGNINKALPLESSKPDIPVPASPQDPSVGLSLSIDDILNTQVSEETVSEIIDTTSHDPAFEALFSLFNVDKEQFAKEQRVELERLNQENGASTSGIGNGDYIEPMDTDNTPTASPSVNQSTVQERTPKTPGHVPPMAVYGKSPTDCNSSPDLRQAKLPSSKYPPLTTEISQISAVLDINEDTQMEMEPVVLPSLDGSEPQIMSPVPVTSASPSKQTSTASTVPDFQTFVSSASSSGGHCMVPPKKRQLGLRMDGHSSFSGLSNCWSPDRNATSYAFQARQQLDNSRSPSSVPPASKDQGSNKKASVQDSGSFTQIQSKSPKSVCQSSASGSSNDVAQAKRELFTQQMSKPKSSPAKLKSPPVKECNTSSDNPKPQTLRRRTSGRKTRSPKRFSPCTPTKSRKDATSPMKRPSPAKSEKGQAPDKNVPISQHPNSTQGSSRSTQQRTPEPNTPKKKQEVMEQYVSPVKSKSVTPKKFQVKSTKLKSPARNSESNKSNSAPVEVTTMQPQDANSPVTVCKLSPLRTETNNVECRTNSTTCSPPPPLPKAKEHVKQRTMTSPATKPRLKNVDDVASSDSAPERVQTENSQGIHSQSSQPVSPKMQPVEIPTLGRSPTSSRKSPSVATTATPPTTPHRHVSVNTTVPARGDVVASPTSPCLVPPSAEAQDLESEPNTPQMQIVSQPSTPQNQPHMSPTPPLTPQVAQTIEVVSDEMEQSISGDDSPARTERVESPSSLVTVEIVIDKPEQGMVGNDLATKAEMVETSSSLASSEAADNVEVVAGENEQSTVVVASSAGTGTVELPAHPITSEARENNVEAVSDETEQSMVVDVSADAVVELPARPNTSEARENNVEAVSGEIEQSMVVDVSSTVRVELPARPNTSETRENNAEVLSDATEQSMVGHTSRVRTEIVEPPSLITSTVADNAKALSAETEQSIVDNVSKVRTEVVESPAVVISESVEVASDQTKQTTFWDLIGNTETVQASEDTSAMLQPTTSDEAMETSELERTIKTPTRVHEQETSSVKHMEVPESSSSVIEEKSKDGSGDTVEEMRQDNRITQLDKSEASSNEQSTEMPALLSSPNVASSESTPKKDIKQVSPSLVQGEPVVTVPCVISAGVQPMAILQAPVPLPYVQSPAKKQNVSVSAEVQSSIGPMQALLKSSNLLSGQLKAMPVSSSNIINLHVTQRPLQTIDSTAIGISLGQSQINVTPTGRKVRPILPNDIVQRCRNVTIVSPSVSVTPVSAVHSVTNTTPSTSELFTPNGEHKNNTDSPQTSDIMETPRADTNATDNSLIGQAMQSVGIPCPKSGSSSKSSHTRPPLRRLQRGTPQSLIKRGMVVRSLDVGGNMGESTPKIIIPRGAKGGYVVRTLDCQDTSNKLSTAKTSATPKGSVTLKGLTPKGTTTTPKPVALSKSKPTLPSGNKTPTEAGPVKAKQVTPKKRTPRKQNLNASASKHFEAEVDLAAEVLASCSPKKTPIKQIIRVLSDDSSEISRAAETLISLSHSPPSHFTAIQKANILRNLMNSPRRNLMAEQEIAKSQAVKVKTGEVRDKTGGKGRGKGQGKGRGRPSIKEQALRAQNAAKTPVTSSDKLIANGIEATESRDGEGTTSKQTEETEGLQVNGDETSGHDEDKLSHAVMKTEQETVVSIKPKQTKSKKRSRDEMSSDQHEAKKPKRSKGKRKSFPTNMDVDKFLSQLHYPQ